MCHSPPLLLPKAELGFTMGGTKLGTVSCMLQFINILGLLAAVASSDLANV